MAPVSIQPESDEVVTYHQKLSWKITEENWNNKPLICQLKTKIPGSMPPPGGHIGIYDKSIVFTTYWPKDVDIGKIHVEAVFSLKSNDTESSVDIKCHKVTTREFDDCRGLAVFKIVKINPENIYNEERSFTLEAELLVDMNDPNKNHLKKDYFKEPNSLVNDIKSIFHDVKNSDFKIVAEDETFQCHKNILSARSDVLKNMLAHDTQESRTNTLVTKDVPANTVEDMLKYIYTGEIPENLSSYLLHIADFYQLDSLKEACVENLLESLDVRSCISTFIMVDRYFPQGGELRENVVLFMKCKAEEVVDMKDWDKLMATYPSLAKELVKAIAKGVKEKHKCQFCLVSYK